MFAAELRADSYFGKASVCVFGEVKEGHGERGNNAYKLVQLNFPLNLPIREHLHVIPRITQLEVVDVAKHEFQHL